ncbi:MAG: putative lipoprotein [Myxococcaceae bacterium]|nr:putative lipoprotein [Myxococcaceae bacterium]
MRSESARIAAAAFVAVGLAACTDGRSPPSNDGSPHPAVPVNDLSGAAAAFVPLDRLRPVTENEKLIQEGRNTFRFDTFGDEAFWGKGGLELNRAIAGKGNGGFGVGVSPKTALAAGLKVDALALPADLVTALKAGQVDLDDPKTTIALLKLDAVLGLKGLFEDERLVSVGITCALCHSTVDDSFAPGIGQRRDGWANRDLEVGTIIGLAEDLSPVARFLDVDEATVRAVLQSWGPGRFDPQLFLDGKGFRPDGNTAAILIPPAFGLAGVNLSTSTGWGSLPYWNALVAVLEMHGQGNFLDVRLDDPNQFPVAARNQSGHVAVEQDLVSPKLPGLQAYQLSLRAPAAPKGSFDEAAAARGAQLFVTQARCSTCHVAPLFTEPGYNLHRPDEIGVDDFQANRSPEKRYRTTPLRGLWTHPKGGYFHDGRFATLLEVVTHYDQVLDLGLDGAQQQDLVAYLLSL